jgi:7-cyano-7-deazaguanine synthase
MIIPNNNVLVVLSGGQDSTTCLYWAKHELLRKNALKDDGRLHAVTFDYAQRHRIEIDAAKRIAAMAGCETHELIPLRGWGEESLLKSSSPLVSNNQVGQYESASKLPGGVEPTFIPCRNILFLTIAANRAVALGCQHIVTGVCEEDYGGYPDCRHAFIQCMQRAVNQGITGHVDGLIIHAPLMSSTKRETVEMGAALPGCMEALAYSHTCYNGMYPPDAHNHASILRARGFYQAQLPDPLITRAKAEGRLPQDYPEHGLVEGTKYALKPAV